MQPNAVTYAQYDFCQIEKDIMYFIIDALQSYVKKEITVQHDLFGGIGFELQLKAMVKSKNHTKFLGHVRDLMKKPVSYVYNKEKKVYEITTVLVSSMTYERNSGRLVIKIPQEAVPVMLNITSGFTLYNRSVALTLPSVYAKRMYELCCRWKDKGFFRISLVEFRKMFSIENKHLKICDLREYVLDMAQKHLCEHADITYTYDLRKENGSRSFNWLYLWINCHSIEESQKEKHKAYQIVFNFMYEIFRNSTATDIADTLLDNGDLKRAADRFTRMKTDIRNGRIKKHGINQYAAKVLHDDFKIPETLLGECYKKTKQREASEKLFTELIIKKQKELKTQMDKMDSKKTITKEECMALFNKTDKNKRDSNCKSLSDLIFM